jgi:agmatine deiminase
MVTRMLAENQTTPDLVSILSHSYFTRFPQIPFCDFLLPLFNSIHYFMKKLFAILFLLSIVAPLSAQIEGLPVGFAPGEEALMPDYLSTRGGGRGITTPPTGSLRTAAEWEEIQALFVAWEGYTSTLTQIVRYAREECLVVIVCADSNAVKATLSAASVPLTNVDYIQEDANTVWLRDYGSNTVYQNGVDSLLTVDWIYNRPRPLDDVVPDHIGAFFNVPVYSTTTAPYDLMNTGGNFMSDGNGTAFASELVLDENDGAGSSSSLTYPNHTELEIDSIMYWFMGIDRYIKMETLPYDGIHHIDMHMKLLDEETLLVGEYPAGTSDGPQIEANLQYVLSNFNSMYGTPYEVVRIVQPPDGGGSYPWNFGDYRTYANAVFVNKTVLLPIYEPEFDTTALRIWEESLPGYRVIGINCNSIIQASGAIHCITHSLGVNDPLLITHQRIRDTYSTSTTFTVDATIRHRSGIASATMYYTTDTLVPYTAVTMTNASGDEWTATIPAQAGGTEVFYYIHAAANSGKEQVRPLPAPDGYWNFHILVLASSDGVASNEAMMQPVFPNPARAITCIPVHSDVASSGHIYLVDVMGRVVKDIHNGLIPSGDSKYFFNAAEYASGTYLVVMESGELRSTQRVLIQ